MKIFFISVILLLTVNLSSDELSWVDEQVEAIKPPRIGMKSRELSILKDPFIFLTKNKSIKPENKNARRSSTSNARRSIPTHTTSSTKNIIKKKKALFTLTAIINTSAMINGKWYKIGDITNGYKVSKIDSTSVLLTKKSKKLLLSTNSKSKNLNFKNK